MLPAGPLSTTPCDEMLSSRQPFSVLPSDSTRELAPVKAKIAMRKCGPITTPVSLTPRNNEAASPAEDAVAERRGTGLNSGSASFGISGAAGEGRWLTMGPNSMRISPAETTHPTRIKAGERAICFNTTDIRQSKDFTDAAAEASFREEHRLLPEHLRYDIFAPEARVHTPGPIRWTLAETRSAIMGWPSAMLRTRRPVRGMRVFLLATFAVEQ